MGLNGVLSKFFVVLTIFLIVSLVPVSAANLNFQLYGYGTYQDKVVAGQSFEGKIVDADAPVFIVDSEGNEIPCSCEEKNNSNYDCDCYFGELQQSGQTNVNIMLNDSPTSESHTIFVDAEGPRVTIKNCEVIGQNISLSYEAEDSIGNNSGVCSGIKEINIFVDNYLEKIIPVNTINCTFGQDINFTLDNPIELFNVEIEAIDNVENRNSSIYYNLTMDVNPPVIQDYFELWQGSIMMDKIAVNNPTSPVVSVAVFIDEVNLSYPITADLSGLNNLPTQNIGYNLKRTSNCYNVDNFSTIKKCVFNNIALHASNPSLTIKVTAMDGQDNVVTKTITQEFPKVVSQNEVVWIGPNQESNCYEGKCFVGKYAILEVVLSGTNESGFRQMNIPIKVSQLSESQTEMPFSCVQDGIDWVCKYLLRVDPDVAEGSKNIYIDSRSSDDYGRRLTGLDKKEVIVDLSPPELVGSEDDIEVLVNGNEVLDNCLTSNDVMTVNFDVSDDRSNKIIAWTNNNFTATNYQKIDCTDEGNKFSCSLQVRDFANYAEQDKNLEVFASDLAGNKYSVKNISMGLCEPNLEDTPVFISSIDVDNNFEVDKRVASYKYWKSYIPLEFRGMRSNAKLTSFDIEYCEAYDEDAGTDYIYTYDNSFSVIPDESSQTGGTAVVYVGGQDILTDSVKLKCQMNLYGHDDKFYYLKPQKINFTTTLNFYGDNIAGPDETLQKKIDGAKARAKQIKRQYETYEHINMILGTFCQLGETMATINGVIQAVNGILAVLAWIPPLLVVAKWFDKTVANPSNSLVTLNYWPPGNPLSWIVLGRDPTVITRAGWWIKGTCWIYTCKFYDAKTITDIAADKFITHNTRDKIRKKEAYDAWVRGAEVRRMEEIEAEIAAEMAQIDEGMSDYDDWVEGELNLFQDNLEIEQALALAEHMDELSLENQLLLQDMLTDEQINNQIQTDIENSIQTLLDEGPPPINTVADSVTDEVVLLAPSPEEVAGIIPLTQESFDEMFSDTESYMTDPVTNQQYEVDEETMDYMSMYMPEMNTHSPTMKKFLNSQYSESTLNENENSVSVPNNRYQGNSRTVTYAVKEIPKATGNFLVDPPTNAILGDNGEIIDYASSIPNAPNLPGGSGAGGVSVAASMAARQIINVIPTAPSWDQADSMLLNVNEASGSWFVNPYRSNRLDSLCVPAILFNYKKEREIQCLYIKCLEQAKATGMGSDYCEELKDYRSCLYLESAMVDAVGPMETFKRNFGTAAMAAVMGTAMSIGMQALCGEFYASIPAGSEKLYPWYQSVACGVMMSGQAINTIMSGTASTFSSAGSALGNKDDLGDNCKGIDW